MKIETRSEELVVSEPTSRARPHVTTCHSKVILVFGLKTLLADVLGQFPDQVKASWGNVLTWLPLPLQSPSSTKSRGGWGPAVKTGLAVDDHG